MLLRLFRSGQIDIMTVLMYILSSLIVIFLVLPLHECAHGFVASKLGDDTAKRQGRITLDPLAHIDYMGALLLLLIGFGWAKPVPINPRRFKNPKVGMALTALAGPMSNFLAAVCAALLRNGTIVILLKNNIYPFAGFWFYLLVFLEFLVTINIGLAVFNFIPIPPLDGSKILMAFLPNKTILWIAQREQMISIVLFVVIMMGGLNGILNLANGYMSDFVNWLTWQPFAAAFN